MDHSSSISDEEEALLHSSITRTPGGGGGGSRSDLRDQPPVTHYYVFTGKLTLFPLLLMLSVFGAAIFLSIGHKHAMLLGWTHHKPVTFGVVGLLFSLLALAFLISLLWFIVINITFTFSRDSLVITKRGVFRRTTFTFRTADTHLHYFRTHFLDERAWLQLVVCEKDRYYRIISWRGKGNQKRRFLELFHTLQRELRQCKPPAEDPSSQAMLPAEVISQQELTLINPFTARLRVYRGRGGPAGAAGGGVGDLEAAGGRGSSWRPQNTPSGGESEGHLRCIEDIQVVNFDRFFRHFDYAKVRKGADALTVPTYRNVILEAPRFKAAGH